MPDEDKEFKEVMKLLEKARSIICPYCMEKQSQETLYEHVTYWGEPNREEDEFCDCDHCGKKFIVKEHVERTFTSEEVKESEN